MRTLLLAIGLMLLPLGVLALEGKGVTHAFPNSHQNISAAKVSPKLNFPKHKSDNLAGVISSESPTLNDLDKTLKDLDANLTQYNGQESKSWWEKIWTDPNVTFAGFVALFTLGLVFVGFLQVTKLKKTLDATLKTAKATLDTAEATKASAEATKVLADATLNIESPIIIVQKAKMVKTGNTLEEIITSDLTTSPFIRIPVKNIGRTPAFLDHELIILKVFRELPERPDYPIKFKFPKGIVLASGDSNEIQQKYCHTSAGTRSVLNGEMSLWAYGYIAYRDFIGREHKTGFCYRWYPPDSSCPQGRWEYEGPAAYLYIT